MDFHNLNNSNDYIRHGFSRSDHKAYRENVLYIRLTESHLSREHISFVVET